MIVSDAVRPPGDPAQWSRGHDPFHVNCFEGFSEDIKKQVISMTPGEQKAGWFLLDAWGQEIGFVPDGTVFEEPNK